MNEKLFDIYLNELLEWNKKFNLTSITDPEEVRLKHFEDSLSLLKAYPLTTQTLADIGTGAGFPGIPLKIVCPDIKLTLIEATRKKTEFLKHIVKVLDLKDVEIIWSRAEDIKNRQFDVAVARAVAKLDKLVKWCLPLVKPGGVFVAMKGPEVEKELGQAQTIIKKLGGKFPETKKISLPNSTIKRSLILVKK